MAVEGEVKGPKQFDNGPTFFTLRDRAAQISVRVPRGRRCRAIDGERVCVTGSVGYDNQRGSLQLVAEEVVPVGEGAVAAMIAEARARLAAEGLLDRARRPIPLLPRRIGVVCGAEAAVRGDIESVVTARFPGYPVRFLEVSVSGAGAADAMAGAVKLLGEDPDVEVIILARGGGDAAQLLPFSDEVLCRALCASPVPVVSAVGHEGDRPLCDEVADLRCGTPSLAAAAVVPDRAALEADLDRRLAEAAVVVTRRLGRGVERLDRLDPRRALDARAAAAHARLANSRARLEVLHPARRLTDARQTLARTAWRAPLPRRVSDARTALAAHRRELEALSPQRVLERGYAVVRDAEGRVVRAASDVTVEARVDLQLASGSLAARVEEVSA